MTAKDDSQMIVVIILYVLLVPAFMTMLVTGDTLMRWNMIYLIFGSAGFIAMVMGLGVWVDN